MSFPSINEQMDLIKRGTVEVLPEEELVKKALMGGIRFIPIRQRHMGSDMLPKIIQNIAVDLRNKGVKFKLNTTVTDIISENRHLKVLKTTSASIPNSL